MDFDQAPTQGAGSPFSLSRRHRRIDWLFLIFLGSAIATPARITPHTVAQSIARFGPRETLERVYHDQTQWDAILAGIATGMPAWLTVATQLYKVSDAAASEQISLATGEALEHRPADVLRLVIGDLGLETVCSGPDVDDPRFNSYQLAVNAIERRQRILRALQDSRLADNRDACIRALEDAKVEVRKFYRQD